MSIDIDSIPKKPRYRLSEVCELTDTQPYVLRFWESEFSQLEPEKGKGGQAVYRRADIALILRIKELLYEQELNIADARVILDGESPAPAVSPRRRAAPAAAPESASEPRDSKDSVSRARYEDALEEIGTLRLRIEELEHELRATEKAALRHPGGDAWPAVRDRLARIADRLEAN